MTNRKSDHSSSVHPDIPNKKGVSNWVEKAGGLPKYLERVAKHIMADSGYTVSRAIAAAVNWIKKQAAKGNVQAAAALAEWNRKRVSGKIAASVIAAADASVRLSATEEIRLVAALTADGRDRPLVGLARVLEVARGC